MILCLDVGNSQIFGGVFQHDHVLLRFRHDSCQTLASDQIGLFLKAVLRENNIEPQSITAISIASVVPSLEYSLRSACIKYFEITPFMVEYGIKTPLDFSKCPGATDLGADRLADCIAAQYYYPNQNLIIFNMGTATKIEVVSGTKQYLGGAIIAGLRMSMEALGMKTAKLSAVEIVRPQCAVGRNTTEQLQSGLYYTQIGMVRELSQRIIEEEFSSQPVSILGTGGFAYLFEKEKVFSELVPDLVLQGIRLAYEINNQGR